MCPEFAGPAPRGLKWRRFRPENAHLRLPDRRKPTGAAGKGKFRSKSQKKPPNQRFPSPCLLPLKRNLPVPFAEIIECLPSIRMAGDVEASNASEARLEPRKASLLRLLRKRALKAIVPGWGYPFDVRKARY